MAGVNETAEERRERRRRREQQIRERLEDEARALNDAIFSGPIMAAERQRDMARLQAAPAGGRAGQAFIGGQPGADRVGQAFMGGQEPWMRDAFAAGGGRLRAPPPQTGTAQRAAGVGRAGPARGLDGSDLGRDLSVACPACFRPVPLSDMEQHRAQECPARNRPVAGSEERLAPVLQQDAAAAALPDISAGELGTTGTLGTGSPEVAPLGMSKAVVNDSGAATHPSFTPGQPAPKAADRRLAAAEAAERRLLQRQHERGEGQGEQQGSGLGHGKEGGGNGAKQADELREGPGEGQGRRQNEEAEAGAQETDVRRPADAFQAGQDGQRAGGTHDGQEQATAGASISDVCVICLETEAVDSSPGIFCPEGSHFICENCFSGHVAAHSTEEPSVLQRRRGLLCPLAQHGCSDRAYGHTHIARMVPEHVFASYFLACERMVEARVLADERQTAARGRGQAGQVSAA